MKVRVRTMKGHRLFPKDRMLPGTPLENAQVQHSTNRSNDPHLFSIRHFHPVRIVSLL